MRRGLTLGLIIALFLVVGLGLVAFLGWNMGPTALVVGIVGAVLPVPVLVFCFLWLDRYEPAPIRHLAFCFGWGAIIATSVALAVNTGSAFLFDRFHLPDALVAVLVAPIVEETGKATGPLLLAWRRRRSVSGMIDGIVFCGLSATGFAMVENVLYLGGHGYRAGAEDGGVMAGAAQVVGLFFVRIVMSGFAHPLFTSMTGVGIGIASRSAERRVRWLAPIGGLLVAMMLHGSWNFMSVYTAKTARLEVLLYGYVGGMVPIFFGMVGFALWLRSSEGRVTERVLPLYVRSGWFSPPEVAALGTLGRRMSARQWARKIAGEPGLKAMRAYQFEATKLALLRDGIRRGLGVAPNEVAATMAEERRLLLTIDAYRRVFAGRDRAMPPALWDGTCYQVTFPDGRVIRLPQGEQPVMPVPVRLVAAGTPFQQPMPYPYR